MSLDELYQRYSSYKEAIKPFFDWLEANQKNLEGMNIEDKMYEAWLAGKETSHVNHEQ